MQDKTNTSQKFSELFMKKLDRGRETRNKKIARVAKNVVAKVFNSEFWQPEFNEFL